MPGSCALLRAFSMVAARKAPAKEKPGEFADDVAIAGLGEKSIMDEDPTVKQLLAEQIKPVADPDAIPAAGSEETRLKSRVPEQEQAKSRVPEQEQVKSRVPEQERLKSRVPEQEQVKSRVPEQEQVKSRAPEDAVPDFRGKSMRDVVEEASGQGLDVMVEGSGVARALVPLPSSRCAWVPW